MTYLQTFQYLLMWMVEFYNFYFSPLVLNKTVSIDFSAILVNWKLCFCHTIMWVCRNTSWLSVLCNFIMHERNHLNNSTFYRLKGEHRHYTFLTHLCQKHFFEVPYDVTTLLYYLYPFRLYLHAIKVFIIFTIWVAHFLYLKNTIVMKS